MSDTKVISAEINRDEMSASPREWDNLGTMICLHKRYSLGDKETYTKKQVRVELKYTPEELQEIVDRDDVLSLPIYMYDHSGITISTSPFSCPWDSGQLGYIFVTHEDIKNNYGELNDAILERAKNVLQSEVDIYDQYLRGNVWSVTIEEDDGIIDSCSGFIGDELEDTGILDNFAYVNEDVLRKAWDERFN